MRKNNEGEWMFFNREYVPLGWNSTKHATQSTYWDFYSDLPVYTKYKGLTEAKLEKLAWSKEGLKYDDVEKIEMVFFYNDKTNPLNDTKHWPDYIDKLKLLSKLQIDRKVT